MKYFFAVLLVFFTSPVNGQAVSKPIVFESEVEVTYRARVEHEHSTRLAAHRFTTTVPKETAKLVRQHTEIECSKIGLNISVIDHDGVFGEFPVMLGDSHTEKVNLKIGEVVQKHDYSYTFKRVFEVSTNNSFVAEGAYEFKNDLNGKICFVVCRMTGTRDVKGLMSGKSEWIGPIVLEGTKTTMSLPSLFEERPKK